MGPFEEVLQAAAALGLQAPAAEATEAAPGGSCVQVAAAPDHHHHHQQQQQQQPTALQQAQLLVEQCRALHDLELRLAALADHTAARDVSDRARLAGRAAAMDGAAATLQAVGAAKDALADRLRFASTRPSVPVAPAYQPDFSALLRAAAGSAGGLHEGLAAVQWAVALDARPSCWEDQLRVIREAAGGVRDCLAGMREFEAALARAGDAAAAAANATGAAGGDALA